MTNRGDDDDFGVARDVATYFDAKGAAEDFDHMSAVKKSGKVILKDGAASLEVDEVAFVRAFVAAFLPAEPFHDWKGSLTSAGIRSVAVAARADGDDGLAVELEQFGARVKGLAAVARPDGSMWRPQVVAKKCAHAGITGLPTPMAGGPKKLGPSTPLVRPNPAPTSEVTRREVAADVEAYFGGDDDE